MISALISLASTCGLVAIIFWQRHENSRLRQELGRVSIDRTYAELRTGRVEIELEMYEKAFCGELRVPRLEHRTWN